jgi:hypothetical protein
VDNSKNIPYGQPGHDKLFKVRPLLDALVPRFRSEYKMHKECSIDEAMIPFKGRLAFKQYIKDKPTKWGIKVFVLADAHNGYVSNLEVWNWQFWQKIIHIHVSDNGHSKPCYELSVFRVYCCLLSVFLDSVVSTCDNENLFLAVLFKCL